MPYGLDRIYQKAGRNEQIQTLGCEKNLHDAVALDPPYLASPCPALCHLCVLCLDLGHLFAATGV